MVMEIVVSLVLLFVGIAVLIIIHVCIVGRAFRAYGNGASAAVQRVVGGGGGQGMSREELKKLPCFDYSAAEAEKANNNNPMDCAVCLENFNKGDKCRLLPNCNHFFHSQCIDSWLLKTPICPICRAPAGSPKISEFSRQESGISRDDGAELA